MMVPSESRGVALVTGASSGIGRATAQALARQGFRTVVAARRGELLEELAREIADSGGEALPLEADLSAEADRVSAVEQVRSEWGAIDVLVNNAGLGWYGYGAEMPWAVAREMLEINVAAVIHLTLLVLPEMRQRRSGHIVNVGSIAGMMSAQGIAVYGASKSFLASFSRALCREMRSSGVHVSLVQVGIISGTEFYDQAAARPGALRIPVGSRGASPQQIGDCVTALLDRPRKVVYVPRLAGALAWTEKLFGWVLDLAGPVHLHRASARSLREHDSS